MENHPAVNHQVEEPQITRGGTSRMRTILYDDPLFPCSLPLCFWNRKQKDRHLLTAQRKGQLNCAFFFSPALSQPFKFRSDSILCIRFTYSGSSGRRGNKRHTDIHNFHSKQHNNKKKSLVFFDGSWPLLWIHLRKAAAAPVVFSDHTGPRIKALKSTPPPAKGRPDLTEGDI